MQQNLLSEAGRRSGISRFTLLSSGVGQSEVR